MHLFPNRPIEIEHRRNVNKYNIIVCEFIYKAYTEFSALLHLALSLLIYLFIMSV